jgi:hypothetical protein
MDSAFQAWGTLMLVIAALGTAWAWLTSRDRAFNWTLLLWLPIPFYAYSISYGSVPIFLPVWWPHSWYNTRYGMEMLPAFALGLAFAAQFVIAATREFKPSFIPYTVAALYLIVAVNAWNILRHRPLTYIEGTKNIESRRQFEENVPPLLRSLLAERPGGLVLMNTSVYPNLIAFSGIPLRQTINEGDREYLSAALSDPAAHVAIVVAFEGNDIDAAVKKHPEGLRAVARFTSSDQPPITVYVSDTPTASKAPER